MSSRALPAALLILLLAPACAASRAAGMPADPAGSVAALAPATRILVMLRIPPPHFRADAQYSGGYALEGEASRARRADGIARRHGLRLDGSWQMIDIGVDCFVMEVPRDGDAAASIESVARESGVEWAQPMQRFRGLGHDDPLFALQPAARAWHLEELHAVATGRGVSVAVLDSGVERDHPDFGGQIEFAENFVDESPYASEAHGTAVAGIIGARADNRIGIAGIAPRARILALRACWQDAGAPAECSSFTIAKAMQFALSNGAQVLNLSLTGPEDPLLQRLLAAADARGAIVVAAADPARDPPGFPASDPHVIAVRAGARASSFASVGAPDTDVMTTLPGARWGLVDGSSFAAAHVSGLAALVRELAPSMHPAELRRTLLAADRGGASAQGGGIDACAVVSRAAGSCACACADPRASGKPASPRP